MKFEKQIKKLEDLLSSLDNKELAEKQHEKGKLTARERISILLDEGTFVELDPFVKTRCTSLGMDKKGFDGDSVITGYGKINNRIVCVYSQDFSKNGGSLGEMHGKKIVKVIDHAYKNGCPVVGIIDSGGARIQEGISSLDQYASIFRSMARASGVVPQISIITGPSAGGASYAPGLSDFIFMVNKISQMYITGPEVIKKVTGEEVNFEDLGGANVHSSKSGCSHFIFEEEKECLKAVRSLLQYLPENNMDDPVKMISNENKTGERLLEIVPEEGEKAYDMKSVIAEIFDTNSFFEVHAKFATNAIVGFARLNGEVIGLVANQAKSMAGVMDIDSSDKIARFVRFCDAFNIPLVNLVDTPGYLPGTNQEHNGIIRHGAKVLYAYAEASVPKISVIMRKAFGGAYIALASKQLGYDKVIAWPGAEIAVMGPEQAVKIIFKKDLADSKNPEKLEQEKIGEMREMVNPFEAAKLGQIDMIINPKDTRDTLIKSLEFLSTKREEKNPRKHGNIPA